MAYSNTKTKKMVLLALFSAIIIVMTLVPYTGYINYSIFLEITTLHVPVILGAILLGKSGGTIVGGVWGLTCLLRAFTNPAWAPFTNPMVSLVPRIIVGLVAALVYAALRKTKLNDITNVIITAAVATITNTVLVLSSMYIFGGMIDGFQKIMELLQTIYTTVIGLNWVVEMAVAIIITPIVYKAIMRSRKA